MKWKGKERNRKGVTRCTIAYGGRSGAPLGLAWLAGANVKAKVAR
jgi:hypothetical protein